jgi:hypothetical protein
VAGPGVNPTLLGTVTRTDVLTGTTVQQVTYAGHPLYRFFLDSVPGNTAGEGLFDPFVSPPGVWHLVSPPRGRPALPAAALEQGTVTVTRLGTTATVLEAIMDQGLGVPRVHLRCGQLPQERLPVPVRDLLAAAAHGGQASGRQRR